MLTANLSASDAELADIRAELPEIELLSDRAMQDAVATVWATFLRDSNYDRISDAPAFPGLPAYDLCGHTRQVVQHCVFMADTLKSFWSQDCDREALIAGALAHDVANRDCCAKYQLAQSEDK